MKKLQRTSTNLAGTWLGLAFTLSLAALFLSLLKIWNSQRKMITINKDGGTIYRLLIEAGFNKKYSQWITAQSAHETANFESPIYRNNLNAFGIKFMGQKTAPGEKSGYAYYNSYADSVADYKRLWKSYGFVSIGTVDNFVKFLKERHYFEAPEADYLRGVTYFLALYFPEGELDPTLKIHGGGGYW